MPSGPRPLRSLAIEVESREAAKPGGGTVIGIDQLTSRIRASEPQGGVSWKSAATLEDLPVGGLHRTSVAGMDVLLCRLPSGVYAYQDSCAGCGASLREPGCNGHPRHRAAPCSPAGRAARITTSARRASTSTIPQRHLEPSAAART